MTPRGMTAEKLRAIADWLDTYDLMAEQYIGIVETLVRQGLLHSSAVEHQEVLAVVRSSEIQDELRRWALDLDWEGL